VANYLDSLIDRIEDDALRADLIREIRGLRNRKDFGLVFERHLPETVRLYSHPVKVGATVQERADNDGPLWTVRKITKGKATIERREGVETISEVMPADDLVVVRRFGDAIYPGLTSLGRIERGGEGRPWHAVIEAENYHALETLLYAYEGKIDAIYIDPPYNTGARDWKYNNRFVDGADEWHHSKWLSMMEKRLRLSRRLLARDGVLIVTIDEHEVHHLGLLLEEMFPSADIHAVTIVHNPKGTYKRNVARVDETAFFVCPGEFETVVPLPGALFTQAPTPEVLSSRESEEVETEHLYLRRRGQESGYRNQRPNQFYAILVNEVTREVVGLGPLLAADDPWEITRDGDVVTVYPLDTRNDERVWRYSRETMQQYIDNGAIIVTGHSTRSGQGWVLNHQVVKKERKRVKSVWWEKRHDAGGHGSDLLTAYLGVSGLFPFPKSVYAVRDCLAAVVADRPNALVLDFFAGSGSTCHAVCLLNAEDGGQRRSIMVTNNEVSASDASRLEESGHHPGEPEYESHGIFQAVTRPRTEAVITGLRADGEPVAGDHTWAGRRPYAEGFEENVEFFRLDYLDRDQVSLGRAFEAVAPLLWLKAGGVGARVEKIAKPWALPDGGVYGVLFDAQQWASFVHAVAERGDEVRHAFVVTDSTSVYQQVISELPPWMATTMLYEDYLSTFTINTGGRP
jgi:adenine-specific DNA-methyltransferase